MGFLKRHTVFHPTMKMILHYNLYNDSNISVALATQLLALTDRKRAGTLCLHMCCSCTCPLCDIDQATVKLVTKA